MIITAIIDTTKTIREGRLSVKTVVRCPTVSVTIVSVVDVLTCANAVFNMILFSPDMKDKSPEHAHEYSIKESVE